MARPKRIYGLGHPRGGVKAPTEFKSEVRHSAEPLRLKVLVGDSLPRQPLDTARSLHFCRNLGDSLRVDYGRRAERGWLSG